MTYCVGLLVDTGLVMLSDSRTNAGVDQINTFRKMATFQHASDRVLVLMSAGNLGITQAVINLLETPEDKYPNTRLLSAANMFNAARVVGDALREIHHRDAEDLKEHGYDFKKIPYVLQLNKRDLPNALPVDTLSKDLRKKNETVIEAVAFQGVGVFETLKEIARQVLTELKQGG